ncbi:hypothetical protein H6504_02865 [Candidatus Woesearchaeota archaeon]|nr:hypothetical protein [Candidatus Woesearchaeota archaeon]
MVVETTNVVLAIVLGLLLGIAYSLRILVLMERRVARIEIHIENLAARILSEEVKIEKEEEQLMKLKKPAARKAKKPAGKR